MQSDALESFTMIEECKSSDTKVLKNFLNMISRNRGTIWAYFYITDNKGVILASTTSSMPEGTDVSSYGFVDEIVKVEENSASTQEITANTEEILSISSQLRNNQRI